MHLAEKADDNNTQESFNTGEIVLMGLYVNYSSPGPILLCHKLQTDTAALQLFCSCKRPVKARHAEPLHF